MKIGQLNIHLKEVLKFLKISRATADIFLVDEKEMRRLNRQFRNKNKSTNVLAFPFPQSFPSPKKGKTYLGEIYLCPSYIKSHEENINFMLVHGLLHLLGFNHIKKSDRILMESLEKEIMSRLIS